MPFIDRYDCISLLEFLFLKHNIHTTEMYISMQITVSFLWQKKIGSDKLQPFVKCHNFYHNRNLHVFYFLKDLIPSIDLILHCVTFMTLFGRGTIDASFFIILQSLHLLYNKSIQINFCFICLVYNLTFKPISTGVLLLAYLIFLDKDGRLPFL